VADDVDLAIRPARREDLAEVERLMVLAFPDVLGPALGDRPLKVKVETLLRLRAGRPDPTAGTVVARTRDGELAGVSRFVTADMRDAPILTRLAALRPLGVLGALRFLAVVSIAFIRYRPAPDEAFLSGIAVEERFRGRSVARRLLEFV
jgi:ribosomal protein S18 acetylase RimI-like enzyme